MKRIALRVFTVVALLAMLGVAVFVYSQRQAIEDHFAARQFDAPAEILDLTENLSLTDAGHRVFWATHPTLDGSQQFNAQCSNVEHSDDGHILGCYTAGNIHLFEIDDERLNGIVEVTAAHELLHATFSRLDTKERAELVDKLWELYEAEVSTNPALEERMSVYSHLSRTGFANELHSVLGSEVRDLPEWLEAHYSKWLQDRGRIVDFFDSYHAVFEDLQLRSSNLQAELAELRESIESRSADYRAAVEQFNADWAHFVARNAAFEFSDNPDVFYALRDEFQQRRDVLSAEMASLNADIDRYEQMRQELIALSELNQELEHQLDSDLAPPAPAPSTIDEA